MTIFHILDAYTQDVEDGAETEESKEIIPRGGNLTDDEDDEFVAPKRKFQQSLGKKGAEDGAGGPVDNTKLHMNIYLFGATAEGKPVRACIEGFQPFFFVRLPDKKAKTRLDFERLLDETLRRKKAWLGKVLERTYEDRKVLYGYTGDQKFRFARLTVPSIAAFRALKRIFINGDTSKPIFQLYAGSEPLEVFEANLDPMLRFFHLRDIKPAGWVETDAEADEDTGQILTDWDEIRPCLTPPMASAPFLLAAWDIECYSENGEFPLAKKGYDRMAKQIWAAATTGTEAAEMILAAATAATDPEAPRPKGMDVLRHRDGKLSLERLRQAVRSEVFLQGLAPLLEKKEGVTQAQKEERVVKIRTLLGGTLRSVLPLAGDPVIQIGVVLMRGSAIGEKHIFVLDTCDDVPGAVVHAYKTEKELILGWAAAMRSWNPDILVGYNVFGFDERYLWERVVELKIQENEAFQSLSRLGDMEKRLTLEEKFLSSSALGDNTMWMWTTFGRLQVDLYHYIKRSFSLPAYKLDYVCQHFMSGKLGGVDTSTSGRWFLKTKSTGDAVVGRYVVLLDETGDVAVDKLRICEIDAGKGLYVDAPEGDDVADLAAAAGDAVKWAVVKDDVSPADIFNLHVGGGAAGRAKVAAYCVQDCDLVVELYKKLDVFNNAMAMANACSVPVSYIFTRGQGIKIESLIFKECYERGQCVVVLPTQPRNPVVPEEGEEAVVQKQEDSYEGAIVLTPKAGFYFKAPIGVADFASLYPSTIISENISHDTLIWAKDYDLEGRFVGYSYGSDEEPPTEGPAVAWTDIEFDIWGVKEGDTRKNPEKVKRGLRVCRYAQFAGDAKGTLPDIVQKLLAARKAKRKEAEKESDPFKKALLDAEQLAYKLTANSLYGQLGSGTFKIRLQHLAASVTAYGRKQIMFAKAAIEKFYGPEAGRADCTAEAAQVVYGDSVKGDTAIFIRKNRGIPEIVRMDELYSSPEPSAWKEWHNTKESQDLENIQIWTEGGWTNVERIIRHKLAPGKKMFRVLTHTGVVDCTEDHSLVADNGEEIKPSYVSVGSALLHSSTLHKEFGGGVWDGTKEEAWVMGFFLADGSSDTYVTASGLKSTWAINKANKELLEKASSCLPFPTKILNTIESSGVYKLVPIGDIRGPATKYRDLFYNESREKRVPPIILNAPIDIVSSFMEGFYAGDGDKVGQKLGNFRWDQKGKEVCSGLTILAQRLGYSISINDRSSKPDVFRITCTKSYQRKCTTTIKKMYEINTDTVEYVYDLQTENHHFAVGPGNLVVHNTDSLFVTFNPKNPETGERLEGREAIVATMKLTEEAGKLVTTCLKPPHDFEYDKVFSPFIIFSKKRYVGNKYEESPDEYYQNSMGIATKRRDYAGIVKVIYGGAIRILLTEKDPVAAAAFVKEKLADLAAGRVSTTQLTMTKSLRAEYKAATPPAHKILADRIAARDPGNAPASGDRISFLYVLPQPGQQASKNQGDRIETPAWIKDHRLEIDAKFYMEHQLMNPISQLFSLIVEELPGCVAPGGRSWAVATDADREYAATEYLFRDALNACDRAAQRRFGAKMFGIKANGSTAEEGQGGTGVVKKPSVLLPLGTGKVVVTPLSPSKSIQTNLSSFFVQKILLKELSKSSQPQSQPSTPRGASPEGDDRGGSTSPPPAPRSKKAGARKSKAKALDI